WTLLDCPGSLELTQETQNALIAADAAVVVCEPEVPKALTLAPLFKFLDDRKIPHLLFSNKMDAAAHRVRELLEALQGVSSQQLTKDLTDDLIVPVLLGSAERDHGVLRLWKALRHEVPGPAATASRIGLEPEAGDTVAVVFKTYHQPHTGKLSLARIFAGAVQ